MRALITGISGKLGRRVARALLDSGWDVIGLDVRPWPGAPAGVRVRRADVRKRPAEDVFRTESPEAVIHMATSAHLGTRAEERHKINLQGTRAVFEHAAKHGVERLVFVGRHTYYGAAADAPLYHREHDPPNAITSYPALADLVAADLYAGSAIWRFPEMATCVLRPCYTLGASHHGTLAGFLGARRVPRVLGFDPLFQFLHEQDVAEAICVAIGAGLRGVYNIGGLDPLPLSALIEASGSEAFVAPEPIVRRALGHFGLPRLSSGAVAHLKYPVVTDSSSFASATGFAPHRGLRETLDDFRTRRLST